MIISLLLLFFTLGVLIHAGLLITQSAHQSGITQLFFKGYIVLSAVLAILSLIFPINVFLSLAVGSVLFVLTIVRREIVVTYYKRLFALIKSQIKATGFVFATFLGVMTFALTAEITLYDTGLYHTQAIKWIQEYAVVPGLGNLHGRFAFNSHFFVISALFSFEFIHGSETVLIYPLNTAAALILGFYLFRLTRVYFSKANLLKGSFYALALCFVILLYPSWVNSPSPDIISAIFVLYALIYFLEKKGEYRPYDLLFLAALIFSAITIKLSNLFLLLLLIPGFVQLLREKGNAIKPFIGKATALGLLIIVPFLIRNVVLSGYLIYPFPEVDMFQVDWKIPTHLAASEKLHIETWAKLPRVEDAKVEAMAIAEWFPKWWNRKSLPFKILLAGNLTSIFSFFLLWQKRLRAELTALIVVGLNLLFWFATAPDPRFVHGFLIFGFALSQATLLSLALSRVKLAPKLATGLLSYGITVLIVLSLFTVRENPRKLIAEHFSYPKPMGKNPLEKHQTNFAYVVPIGNNRCFNAELPCLPRENLNILLRSKRIEEGFWWNSQSESDFKSSR